MCLYLPRYIYRTSEEVLIRTTKEQKVLGAMGEVSMVIDPETKQPISLEEARRKGILDEAAGVYRDPRTGIFVLIFEIRSIIFKFINLMEFASFPGKFHAVPICYDKVHEPNTLL